MINKIIEQFGDFGIEISELQAKQFYDYFEMLVETNKVMNLTAITEFDDVVFKHFIDSVLIKNIKELDEKLSGSYVSIIDVGTGAGFPGIPLKILYPNIKLTLLDSLNKRIKFLQSVVEKLNLKNVECLHGRAEDFGSDKKYREMYDFSVSRAVANLSTLSEYCLPFVKVGGCFISYKASNTEDEVDIAKKAIKILSSKIIDINKMIVKDYNNTEYERNFVIIRKEKKLSKQYPRKSGIPSKNPL